MYKMQQTLPQQIIQLYNRYTIMLVTTKYNSGWSITFPYQVQVIAEQSIHSHMPEPPAVSPPYLSTQTILKLRSTQEITRHKFQWHEIPACLSINEPSSCLALVRLSSQKNWF